MRRSIASIVLATIAVLMVTASVAAADPFGWRHTGAANGASMYRVDQNTCCSMDRTYPAPATSARPAVAPVLSQTRPTQTVRPAVKPTTTHHANPQVTRHGSDWCDDYGRDNHGMHR